MVLGMSNFAVFFSLYGYDKKSVSESSTAGIASGDLSLSRPTNVFIFILERKNIYNFEWNGQRPIQILPRRKSLMSREMKPFPESTFVKHTLNEANPRKTLNWIFCGQIWYTSFWDYDFGNDLDLIYTLRIFLICHAEFIVYQSKGHDIKRMKL